MTGPGRVPHAQPGHRNHPGGSFEHLTHLGGVIASIWSGTISFGLIAIPVKLFTTVRSKDLSFNQLDDRTMSRIRYQKVSEETGEEVPAGPDRQGLRGLPRPLRHRQPR